MSDSMDKAAESKAAAEAKSKGLGTVNTSGGFGAGAGGGFGLNKPGHGPEVKSFAGKAAGKSIDISADIVDGWKQVLDDAHATAWLIADYGADGKSLKLRASGDGGLKSFVADLPSDGIAWGGFRCYGVDKRGGLECKRAKFVFVQWMPEGISQIKKAKVGPHKGEVKEIIGGTHLDLLAEASADFDEMALITKLQAATGAHKPNGYEFEAGEFIEADFYGLGIGKDCRGETKRNDDVPKATRRPSVKLVTADDENRQLNQRVADNAADNEQLRRVAGAEQADHDAKVDQKLSKRRASNAEDVEQLRRIGEIEAADHEAKLERKDNQEAASVAMDEEQERLVKERGTERKKSLTVDLAAKIQDIRGVTDEAA